MKYFWKIRKTTVEGTIMRAAAAIVAERSDRCCELKNDKANGKVIFLVEFK